MSTGWIRQYGAFIAVSGVAALVNLLARALFSRFLVYEIAVALAYLIGMSVAFVLNRKYVFPLQTAAMHSQYIRFSIVNVLALAQVWIVSVGLARIVFPAIGFTWQAETVAHAIGLAVPAVTSFVGHKYYTFRK